MKVILYMAISVNGMIARENDDTSFVSKIEWKSFRNMVQKTGNIIVGRRTYEIMKNSNELAKIKKIKLVVVSHKKIKDNDIVFVKTPRYSIEILEKCGFKTALVAGGGNLSSSFMKENLVDEIYLDIEPVAIGNGIQLFSDSKFEKKLKLLSTKKLSYHEIQLHYKVIKRK